MGTTVSRAGLASEAFTNCAISPAVSPWTSGPGAVLTRLSGTASRGSLSGPSTRSPPSGLGRSSTTNSMPASAAASMARIIVLDVRVEADARRPAGRRRARRGPSRSSAVGLRLRAVEADHGHAAPAGPCVSPTFSPAAALPERAVLGARRGGPRRRPGRPQDVHRAPAVRGDGGRVRDEADLLALAGRRPSPPRSARGRPSPAPPASAEAFALRAGRGLASGRRRAAARGRASRRRSSRR